MPALVEAVWVLEVRVGQAELLGFRIHQRDEAIDGPSADMQCERFRGNDSLTRCVVDQGQCTAVQQ